MRRRRPGTVLSALLALALVLPAPAAAAGTVDVTMALSPSPSSGSSFTFTPGFPADFTFPASAYCSWELRWGSQQSIDDYGYVDEWFGSIYVRGKASDGYCDPWTLTLPYSRSGNWIWNFGVGDDEGTFYDTTSFNPGPRFPVLHGTNGAAPGAGIPDSTLPGVWLSMPKGTVIGDKVTATAHPFGGYALPPHGTHWSAYAGSCYCVLFSSATNHSLTWTFTASHSGTITVGFNDTGELDGTGVASASVDPRVKSALRVLIRAPLAVHSGTTFSAYATAYGFKGTITYRWYLDRHLVATTTSSIHRYYLVRTGDRLISVIATDRYGHKASRYVWVGVRP